MIRVSAGCDRGESVLVGPVGEEKDADPVVAELAEPEADPLYGLDEVVGGLGRPIRGASDFMGNWV